MRRCWDSRESFETREGWQIVEMLHEVYLLLCEQLAWSVERTWLVQGGLWAVPTCEQLGNSQKGAIEIVNFTYSRLKGDTCTFLEHVTRGPK